MTSDWALSEVAALTTFVFLVHAFLLIPVADRSVRRADVRQVSGRAAILAALNASKLVWLMLALSAMLTWGAVALAGHLGGGTAAAAEAALDGVRTLRRIIVTAEAWGSVLLLSLAAAVLLYWVYRRRLRRAGHVLSEIRQVQVQDLIDKLKVGELPELEPNESMTAIGNVLNELAAKTSQIEAELAAAPDESERSRLEREHAELAARSEAVLQAYIIEDITRRTDIPPDAALEGDMPRPARTFGERVTRFLLSRGLLGKLSWGQRGLLLINLLLAIPTVLVAAQADVASRLDAATARLADLRVELTAREQTAKLAAVTAAPDKPEKSAAPDVSESQISQAANLFGRAFERGAGEAFAEAIRRPSPKTGGPAPAGPSDAEVVRSRGELRASKARRDILGIVAAERPSGGIYLDPDPVRPSGVGPFGSSAYSAETRATAIPGLLDSSMETASALGRNDERPVTRAGREVARELKETMAASRPVRERLVAAAAAYREVARPPQAINIILGEVFSDAVRTASSDVLAPEMTAWLRAAVPDATGVHVNSALSKSFLATLAQTGDLAQAQKAVAQVANATLATSEFSALRATIEATLPSDPDLADVVRSRHPGLRERVDEKLAAAQRDLTKTVYLAQVDADGLPNGLSRERLAAQLDSAVARAGATQTFESIVPPTRGDLPPGGEPPFGAGGVGGGGGGVGGGGGGRKPPGGASAAASRPASAASVARARNFAALRGFARVGGVLIGRDPETGPPALDLRSFTWAREGGRLRFRIGSADGTTIEAGPFYASIVHGALAYAADGRALTATMISAEPLSELKILLHPALIDTALGCRAISIDRFADEATGEDRYPERERVTRAFRGEVWLYEIARSAVVAGILDKVSDDYAEELKRSTRTADELTALMTGQEKGNDQIRAILDAAVATPTDPSPQSTVLHRTEHFNKTIVQFVEACRGPGTSTSGFPNCVQQKSREAFGGELTSARVDVLKAALAPTPTFQIWSGVREAPFRIDGDLSFMNPPRIESLEFMVQAAFTSPPYQKASGRDGGLDETEEQTDPWEFRDLEISRKVNALIASDPGRRDVFQGMIEFTVLQRFFRAALGGRLGDAFPVEALTDLAAATRADVRVQATPRWNAQLVEPRFLAQIAAGTKMMPPAMRDKAETCLKANGIEATAGLNMGAEKIVQVWRNRSSLSKSAWTAACVFNAEDAPKRPGKDESALAALVELSQRIATTRDLRISLGIDTADRSEIHACAPM